MVLSDLGIRSAKPDATKTVKLSDGGGLQLWVTPTGSKLWRVAYRFSGKQKKLALGPYPALTLKAAREGRDAARRLLASGIDPSVHKRLEASNRAAAGANTFAVLADEMVTTRKSGRAPATLAKVNWLIDLARPSLGNRPIADISAAEILRVLRAVEARGRLETARRLRSTISEVFRYAISTDRAPNDPTRDLQGALRPPTVTPRAALTTPQTFGPLLRAIDDYSGSPEVRIALQFLALTFVRPGELRAAEWSEIDMGKATWSIPAARMKMKRAHRVPLAPQSISLLEQLHTLTGGGKFLFPSVRSTARPMSENTLNAALRRLGFTKTEMSAHGFRAAASSILNESGLFIPDAIEAQLAHADIDAVRRAYHRAAYLDERERMMVWWAARIDEMRASP